VSQRDAKAVDGMLCIAGKQLPAYIAVQRWGKQLRLVSNVCRWVDCCLGYAGTWAIWFVMLACLWQGIRGGFGFVQWIC
jgi:hypothetical protein